MRKPSFFSQSWANLRISAHSSLPLCIHFGSLPVQTEWIFGQTTKQKRSENNRFITVLANVRNFWQ